MTEKVLRLPAALGLLAALLSAQATQPRTESFLGNLAPIIRSIHDEQGFPLDYLHAKGMPLEEWRQRGRAEVLRTLSYQPRPVPLDMRIERVWQRNGYELRKISFQGTRHYRIPGYLLVPPRNGKRLPGIVALHDHGGYFVHGKEKLVATDGEHAALGTFKRLYYSGRSVADELARRGFVVLVIDGFYWGERRLQYVTAPPDLAKRVAGLDPASEEYVAAMNRYLRERVYDLNTWISFGGANWMGILSYDDRRSVDLLASLPEVDPARLGCVGLSVGGYRSTYLAGMDPRIKAAVIVGWMTSLPTVLDTPYSVHSGLPDAFGLHASLDHPDVASLGAPDCAILVEQCGRDALFTRQGMEASVEKLRAMYAELQHPERFRHQFYDVTHQFNLAMQEDAFGWLEKWLQSPYTSKQ